MTWPEFRKWIDGEIFSAWLECEIPIFCEMDDDAVSKLTMPQISVSPDRVSFEEYLRESFQVRSRDILRHPEHGHIYNDPAMQFAWDAFQAGLSQGRAENTSARETAGAAILKAAS